MNRQTLAVNREREKRGKKGKGLRKQKNGGWKRREPKTIRRYIKPKGFFSTNPFRLPLRGGGGWKGGK
jgi:hypothetical protein